MLEKLTSDGRLQSVIGQLNLLTHPDSKIKTTPLPKAIEEVHAHNENFRHKICLHSDCHYR